MSFGSSAFDARQNTKQSKKAGVDDYFQDYFAESIGKREASVMEILHHPPCSPSLSKRLSSELTPDGVRDFDGKQLRRLELADDVRWLRLITEWQPRMRSPEEASTTSDTPLNTTITDGPMEFKDFMSFE